MRILITSCSVGLTVLLTLGGFACSKLTGGSTSPSASPSPAVAVYSVSGTVQKGPFSQGSTVTIQELDGTLSPTGKIYTTKTTDYSGSFDLGSTKLASQYIEVTATGYYFNEVSGALSDSTLSLSVYADLSTSTSVNINVLTHLAHDRIKALLPSKKTFAAAAAQAKTEVLSAFNISDTGISDFSQMDISKSGDSNSTLLAASAILQGSNSVAKLSELMAELGADLASNGKVTSSVNAAKIVDSSKALSLSTIRENLVSRYATLGVTASVPHFENFVDSQGGGKLNGSLPLAVTLSGSAKTLSSKETMTVTVSLKGSHSAQNISVALSTSNSSISVLPKTLTFTPNNFYLPQTVTLAGSSETGLQNSTVTLSASILDQTIATLNVPFYYNANIKTLFVHRPEIRISVYPGRSGEWRSYSVRANMVVADRSGNLFYPDPLSGKVKKIDSSGSETVFATYEVPGNNFAFKPLDGSLNDLPYATIAIDKTLTGTLYVASNFKIVKILPTGEVSTLLTFPGPAYPQAATSGANYMATDPSGNLYYTEFSPTIDFWAEARHQPTNRIMKLTPAGVLSVFAGSGVAGFVNGVGTAASFNIPLGVATDSLGNVYVADILNYAIRKITPAGVVTTFAGSGSKADVNGQGTQASFNFINPVWDAISEGVLTVDPFDNLYLSVATKISANSSIQPTIFSQIKRIDPSGIVTSFCGATGPKESFFGYLNTNTTGGSCSSLATRLSHGLFFGPQGLIGVTEGSLLVSYY